MTAEFVLGHITSKWSPRIMPLLQNGPRRFSQLRSQIPSISEKMLGQSLRELERDGIVIRTTFPIMPPRVIYALTPFGHGCADRLAALLEHIEDYVLTMDAVPDVDVA